MSSISVCTGKEVGEYLSELCVEPSFGDMIIDDVASYISNAIPTVKDLIAAACIEDAILRNLPR